MPATGYAHQNLEQPVAKKTEFGILTSYGSIILISASAAICFAIILLACHICAKKKLLWFNNKSKLPTAASEPHLAFYHRKPTTAVKAVKNPSGTHYLKKSPSPTGNKTPIGDGSLSPEESEKISKITPSISPTCEQKNVQPPTHVLSVVHENETDNKVLSKNNTKNIENGPNDTNGKNGVLFFKLRYKEDKKVLLVNINKCMDLQPKDKSSSTSDPYVKLQLLPDKEHKVKTRVLRKSRNPVFDEDFTFFGIQSNKLQSLTLHFAILSFDRYSRDSLIGEVFFTLNEKDVHEAIEKEQVSFQKDIVLRNLKQTQVAANRGELLVSLCWQPATRRVTVVVLKARNLPKMDLTGLADPFVKINFLVDGTRISKKRTHMKKRTLNPVYNESFVFDLPSSVVDLQNVCIEFCVFDHDRVTKNEIIGRVLMGNSNNPSATAERHWKEVMSAPRRQIADWHKLSV
ncbi:synaptotagmin-4 [Daktulosphaira vitifoliae]|uniref:synaptotagmin-4 n=1 Tax=Daktulosphaira vitifoliae TaxID=58002 RepID=UPI0021AAC687|nr:synaptotagmin-4 [Daktulosphaira vitifoliae]